MKLRRTFPLCSVASATIVATLAAPSWGVLMLDGERNLAPPPAALRVPWDLQTNYGSFNGTPISPTQFITAKHIGQGAGGAVAFNGSFYNVVSSADVPGTDLRIFTIDSSVGAPRFTTHAELWNPNIDGTEIGKPLVVIGRGAARGAPIVAALPTGPAARPVVRSSPVLTAGSSTALATPAPQVPGGTRGWSWINPDGPQSWGENVVDDFAFSDDYGVSLTFTYSADDSRLANEAGLAVGDSGGGVFIYSTVAQKWKLAGVNLGVDGGWSYREDGPYFNATIFDARGLYVGTVAEHEYVGPYPTSVPGSSYATRVASYLGELNAMIGSGSGGGPVVVPEPAMLGGIGIAIALLRRRRIPPSRYWERAGVRA